VRAQSASTAAQVISRCRPLAEVSEEPGRLTRPFASPAMVRANALVGGWMTAAGLEARVDPIGNLVGRLPGSDAAAGTLLLGSHLDTVRDAGAFDGPLGVLAAVARAERLREDGTELPFAIDVLGFCDEEGLRYGTAYLGSSAVAGTFEPALLELVDGVALSALTGVAMLFVRCAGGVSHHPDESVDEADVAVALDVLHAFVCKLAGGAS